MTDGLETNFPAQRRLPNGRQHSLVGPHTFTRLRPYLPVRIAVRLKGGDCFSAPHDQSRIRGDRRDEPRSVWQTEVWPSEIAVGKFGASGPREHSGPSADFRQRRESELAQFSFEALLTQQLAGPFQLVPRTAAAAEQRDNPEYGGRHEAQPELQTPFHNPSAAKLSPKRQSNFLTFAVPSPRMAVNA